jgi:hypothetical protein
MTLTDNIIGGTGILAFVAAGGLGLWASAADVPDNFDAFVAKVQRGSRLNAWIASASMVGSLCAVVMFVRLLH